MNYKVGQKLWSIYADTDTGKCETGLYIVRTIRGGYVYAVAYLKGCTWVRLSTKIGDYGWDKNIDPLFRRKCKVGEKFCGLHTTKKAAWRAVIKGINKKRMPGRGQVPKDIRKKVTQTAKRQISKS